MVFEIEIISPTPLSNPHHTNIHNHLNIDIDEEDLLPYTLMLLEYVCNNLMINGRIESWIVIVDWSDVWVTSLPTSKLGTIYYAFYKYFIIYRDYDHYYATEVPMQAG